MTPKKTSWGAVASWYDEMVEDADSYQKQVILPNLMRIIEPKKGISILDIACGQGYFSRAFAENGAKVMGCDISKELIEIAKKNSSQEIEYFVSPSDKLSFMNDGPRRVDLITLTLCLQNIENLTETISECSRVLNPDGRIIVVINHPAFRIPKHSSWQWDMKEKIITPDTIPTNKTATNEDLEYRRIDAYMSDQQFKIDMTPGEADSSKKVFTVSFHRPLQSYFKAFAKVGFSVTRLEEWISHKKSQAGPRGVEEDRMRKEIPMFLCLEGRKG